MRYWEAYRKALPELRFQGRRGDSHNNNASDMVNVALNYSYGYLKIICRTAVNSVGLEPAVGFLHETSAQQTAESMVYDLMEPYRFLCDLSVVEAFESQKLTPHDFFWTKDDYLYRLQWDGRMRFLDSLKAVFNSGAVYKGRRMKWDTVIEEKCLEFARWLTGKSGSLDFTEPAPFFVDAP